MSNSVVHLPVEGPGQDDCGRLLLHLQVDYVRDLRLVVGFYEVGRAGRGIKLELVSGGLGGVAGEEVECVWSKKTLGQKMAYVSMADIYDLLMSGYRRIDKYFAEGEAFAPERRVKETERPC
jgi:hypothetical protein